MLYKILRKFLLFIMFHINESFFLFPKNRLWSQKIFSWCDIYLLFDSKSLILIVEKSLKNNNVSQWYLKFDISLRDIEQKKRFFDFSLLTFANSLFILVRDFFLFFKCKSRFSYSLVQRWKNILRLWWLFTHVLTALFGVQQRK